MRSITPLARFMAAGAFAAAMVPQTPAYAAPNVDQWQHILDCAGWMFSDPDKHRAECSPGHEFFLPGNTFSQNGITGQPPAPPPPPPPPEDNCYSIPSVYTGEARLIPVVDCCNTVSWRSHELGAFGGAVIPVIACCPVSLKRHDANEFGAALIQADVVCQTDASPSDHWIERPTSGLLV